MVQNDAQKASIYLTKFSRLIRLILNNSKNKMVCLSDELEALKLYIEMENFRFDNKFDYSIRIDEEIEKDIIKIPPLILQPYVENAIWHGLMHKEDGRGKLAIDISQKANTIKFIIEDNGIGREKSKTLNTTLATTHQSVGMEITKDRIMRTNELYGLTADIEVIDSEDSKTGKSAGTKVIIQLPVR
jgi:LytS/YehU family sensor histidine kinase